MANLTRAEEFQGVVRLLRRPKAQRPGPDLIVSQLIREEQSMLNDQTQSGQGWTVNTTSFATVANTTEYLLSAASGTHSIGKPLFVYRDLGNGDIMPVPYTDYTQEIHNQKHDFWEYAFGTGSWPNEAIDKVAFFRDSTGLKARVFPMPTDVRTFYVKYATGRLDWSQFTWSDVPFLSEWSFLRQLKAAAFLLPDAEWEGLTFQENMLKRQELEKALGAQIQIEVPKYQSYLKNPQIEPISDSGYWWE